MHLGDILDLINNWALGIIDKMGYPGLGFVMFLENVFPPIPSEIILPMAGSLTLTGRFSMLGVTLIGALGSVAGALFFYGLGYWFDESRVRLLLRRYGKWLLLSEEDLDKALAWFARYDEYVIFFGRMIPIIRSLISVPAGLAKMNVARFCAYTAMGTALWSFLLAFAGRLLGQNWRRVTEMINQYEHVVLVLVVLGFIGFILYRWLQRRQAGGKQAVI